MSDIDLIYPSQTKKPSPPPSEKVKKPVAKRKVEKKDKPDKAYGRTADTDVRTDALLQLVPPSPDKRRPERYAFQFWTDQITRLKKLKQVLNITKDPEDREEVSLSDMVREAIDDYITKKTKQIKQAVRSGE